MRQSLTPGASQAPNDWPAEPESSSVIVSSGRPSRAWRRAISPGGVPAHRAVHVAPPALEADGGAVVDGVAGLLEDPPVEVVAEDGLGPAHAAARLAGRHAGHREHRREVDAAGLPVVDRLVGLEQVGPADHLLERPHADAGHELADLLGHEEE